MHAIKVEKIVRETDNNTLPPARYVITFDAVPPGQDPKIIKPRINSSFSPKAVDRKKAKNGIIENCKPRPTIKKIGFLTIFLKSFILIVNPMPNMTRPNKKGIELLKELKKSINCELSTKKRIIKNKKESFILTIELPRLSYNLNLNLHIYLF